MNRDFIPSEILKRLKWGGKDRSDHIKSIECDPKPCEDCDRIVVDRRVIWRKHDDDTVRKKCMSCKLFYNPLTKKYEIPIQSATVFFRGLYSKNDK
jgi:hypothetical protein